MFVQGVIAGVLLWSVINLVIYFFIYYLDVKYEETLLELMAMGILGWVISLGIIVFFKVNRWYRHFNKRDIIKTPTGELKWCHVKDADDIIGWMDGYSVSRRNAGKEFWEKLSTFDKDLIKKSKINCYYCKHLYKDCKISLPKCKHDKWNDIEEFDGFEMSIKKRITRWFKL